VSVIPQIFTGSSFSGRNCSVPVSKIKGVIVCKSALEDFRRKL